MDVFVLFKVLFVSKVRLNLPAHRLFARDIITQKREFYINTPLQYTAIFKTAKMAFFLWKYVVF